jgi:excisionase family DNA binding protein
MEEIWLSVADVVERIGLSERTIRALIARGTLPARRLQGIRAVRVPASAVAALLVESPRAANEAASAITVS